MHRAQPRVVLIIDAETNVQRTESRRGPNPEMHRTQPRTVFSVDPETNVQRTESQGGPNPELNSENKFALDSNLVLLRTPLVHLPHTRR